MVEKDKSKKKDIRNYSEISANKHKYILEGTPSIY